MALLRFLVVLLGGLPARALRFEDAPSVPHFDAFLQLHGRSYVEGSSEYAMRRQHYEALASLAREQNSQPGRLWTAGVNHLWDWTPEEFSALRGYRKRSRPEAASPHASGLLEVAVHQVGDLEVRPRRSMPAAEAREWSLHALRPADQLSCGSCWAVTAATVLSAHAELSGSNVQISPQHLVNCVPNPQHCGGTGGCDGATVELAYAYVHEFGVGDLTHVPYFGQDMHCNANKGQFLHGLQWETLPNNTYMPLLNAIVNDGPVAVSVAADGWNQYDSGIYDSCDADCVVDHAVTLVGVGSEAGVKYWLIRNSWSSAWGEHGRIRLLRTDEDDKHCGIDHNPKDGTGCEGGESSVRVCGMCGILFDSVLPHIATGSL